jgi:hypothetical protein
MNDITIAELETAMTAAHPGHTGMANDDLICAVMGNDNATALELELAQRLSFAMAEIDTLIAELTSAEQVQH